jgi:hypothetical protein
MELKEQAAKQRTLRFVKLPGKTKRKTILSKGTLVAMHSPFYSIVSPWALILRCKL